MKPGTRQLGIVEYSDCMRIQADIGAEVRKGVFVGMLLVVRHPPTITLGRRTDPGEVHASPDELHAMGIRLHRVERGGGATYHYPGQAVVYPILSLPRFKLGVDELIERIGAAVVSTLGRYGINASWDPRRPGGYVEGAKIASVGIHVSHNITTHGMALNVGPDIRGFDLIDTCKQRGLEITSMAHLLEDPPSPDDVGLSFAKDLTAGLLRESKI